MIADSILEAMETYGGSFVKQLALLYRLADHENRKRIERCFKDVFIEYRKFVDERRCKE